MGVLDIFRELYKYGLDINIEFNRFGFGIEFHIIFNIDKNRLTTSWYILTFFIRINDEIVAYSFRENSLNIEIIKIISN